MQLLSVHGVVFAVIRDHRRTLWVRPRDTVRIAVGDDQTDFFRLDVIAIAVDGYDT